MADSKVVVLTVNSLGNAQTYLDVIQSNVDLFRGIIPAISHYSQNTVLLVASHPGILVLHLMFCPSAGFLFCPFKNVAAENTQQSKILATLKDVFIFSFEQDTVFERFFFTVTKITENSVL